METAFAPVLRVIEERGGAPAASAGGSPVEARSEDGVKSLGFRIREVRGLPRGIGSDHDSFLARGVPGFFWNQAGRANYTRTHHTQHDTYDAAIPEYQRHSAMVIALGALGIANLDSMLPRSKDMTQPPNIATNRRRLGVSLGGDGESDLTIDSIREGSRAEKSGFKPGDRIVKVDGAPVKDAGELSGALNTGAPKKSIVVIRGGKEQELTVEFPQTESRSQ
jgi:membrane-associated protease RseP (regulator of RpoE activity)